MNEAEAKNITQQLYRLYGSDSGYLFGIKPEYRNAVKSIIKISIDIQNDNRKDEKNTLNQYKCRKCGRYFYINENEHTKYDIDFECPYGCDDNGIFIEKVYAVSSLSR